MEGYKFNAASDEDAVEAIRYFKMLGFTPEFDLEKIGYIPNHIFAYRAENKLTWMHNDQILYKCNPLEEVTIKDLSTIANDYAYSNLYKIIINGDEKIANEVKSLIADLGLYSEGIQPVHYTAFGWGIGRKSCSAAMYQEDFDKNHFGKLITIEELRDLAVLHRNDVNDATHSIAVASDRPNYPVFKSSKNIFYTYSENNYKWVECKSINNKTTGLKLIQNKNSGSDFMSYLDQSELELNSEHQKAETDPQLTDFGFGILKSDTIYHYSASCDPHTYPQSGVIGFDGRISGESDYRKLCNLIAADLNADVKKLVIYSLAIVG